MIAPDMATMLSFIVTDARPAGRPSCRIPSRRDRPTSAPSTPSPSTAIPRHRTRSCCSPRSQAAASSGSSTRRRILRLDGLQGMRSRLGAATTSRLQIVQGRGGGDRSSSPSRSRERAMPRHARRDRPLHGGRELARSSRRRSPAAIANWGRIDHGGRQGRRARSTSQSPRHRVRRSSQVASRRRRGRRISTTLPSRPIWPVREIRHSTSVVGRRGRCRRRCGPAISPTATSTSTSTTAPETA